MGVIKIMTWNVKGTGNQIKRRRLELKIKRDAPDILFLQETHQKSEDTNRMYFRGMSIYEKAFGSSKSRGVATLISNRIQFEKNKVIVDKEGRYVIITGCINEEKVTLVNLYVPNENQKDFLNKITELLHIERVGKVIIAGDFNLIRNQMDSTNPTRYGVTGKMGILDNWMSQNGVIDVWREIKGNERMYTFYSKVFNTYSRIDYMFVSKNLMDNVDNMDVGIFKDSDHADLLLELDISLEKKENYWRYDEKLYKNEEDKNQILKKWKENWEWNDNGEVSYEIVWDTMKAIFRGESIKLSSRKYKNYKAKLEETKKLIKELENKYLMTKDRKIWEELKKLKDKQIVEDTEIVKRNLSYLKREFFEFGNKNSRLLARMAKDKKEKREIGVLIDEKGKRCYKKLEKCDIVKKFFQELYLKKEIDKGKLKFFLEKYGQKKIDNEHKEKMEKDITSEEIKDVIQKLKLGKSPGEDGLPAEFYKEFKEILIPKLQKLFNKILHGGEVPVSWNRTIITLIPKVGKDLEKIESYRPISLINQDAKIFTAIIANRLNSFVDKYVNHNQVGFVKGRYMCDIVRRVLNIINIAENNGDKIGILSLDIFKAFDSIQWDTIKEMITALGFGDIFKHIISKLYQKGTARVKINGIFTQDINLEAGTRQGCPLSPTLFLLAMEILTTLIEEDTELIGYKGIKVNLYADDTLVILNNIEKDIERVQIHLKEFEDMTGLKVNWTKSELLMDTDRKIELDRIQNQLGIRVKDSLRYLGIILSLKTKNLKKLNYDIIIKEIEEKIEKYKKLKLSWFGRIAICKMMLLPKFNFLFEMLPIFLTEKDIEVYQKKLDRFCNGDKKPRLIKKLWYQNQKEGGLGIPKLLNYYRAFNAKTIVKILKGDIELWGRLEMEEIKRIGHKWFLENLKGKVKKCNYWLNSLIKSWDRVAKKLIPDVLYLGRVKEYWPVKINNHRERIIIEEKVETIIEWLKFVEIERRKEEIYEKLKFNWFEKIQMNKWTKNCKEKNDENRKNTEFEILVSRIIKDEIGLKGLVSKIYKIINFDNNPQMVIKENWAKELGIEISNQDWSINWISRIMRTLSIRIKEHNYKTIWKWYLTPIRLSQMDNKIDKRCWRCKVEIGTYVHMWCNCNGVKSFWSKIEMEISKMIKKQIKLGSETILLLMLNKTTLTAGEKELVRILIIMGRIIIARYWKLDVELKLEEWYKEIWRFALNDKLTCDIKIRRGIYKEDVFWNTWQPFVDFALEKMDESVPVPRQRDFWKK